MPINVKSQARMDAFVIELARAGLRAVHLSRSTYMLNGHKVSLRTTTKDGPKYWYDFSLTVVNDVDYVIYQMDSPMHFVLFPSSFLRRHYEEITDSNRAHAKQFYVNWHDKTIVTSAGLREDIRAYCCSIDPHNLYGAWKSLL